MPTSPMPPNPDRNAPDGRNDKRGKKICKKHGKFAGKRCPECETEYAEKVGWEAPPDTEFCLEHQIPLDKLEGPFGICTKCMQLLEDAIDTLDVCPQCGNASLEIQTYPKKVIYCILNESCGYERPIPPSPGQEPEQPA